MQSRVIYCCLFTWQLAQQLPCKVGEPLDDFHGFSIKSDFPEVAHDHSSAGWTEMAPDPGGNILGFIISWSMELGKQEEKMGIENFEVWKDRRRSWFTSLIPKLAFTDCIRQNLCIIWSSAEHSPPQQRWDEMRWPSARHCIVFLLVSDNRSYKIQSHLLPNDNQQLLHKQGSFCGATGWPLADHSLREMPFVAGQARSTFHWFSKAQHTFGPVCSKKQIWLKPRYSLSKQRLFWEVPEISMRKW